MDCDIRLGQLLLLLPCEVVQLLGEAGDERFELRWVVDVVHHVREDVRRAGPHLHVRRVVHLRDDKVQHLFLLRLGQLQQLGRDQVLQERELQLDVVGCGGRLALGVAGSAHQIDHTLDVVPLHGEVRDG